MKKMVILGSTGSLGTQTLEIAEKYADKVKVIGMSAHSNAVLLKKQAEKFKIPTENIVLTSKSSPKELTRLASLPQADIIVNVLPGTPGITPTLEALKANKTLLLGNKESLVAAGEEVRKLIKPQKPIPGNSSPATRFSTNLDSQLLPLDSEHNAIFEILQKFPEKPVKKIILPCSGGPFRGKTAKELAKMTAVQALAHPRWKMGDKVTIESAALLNKGLEVIEAYYLFNLPLSKIDIVVHPECMVHGMVEFENLSKKSPRISSITRDRTRHPAKNQNLIAYISPPDMREHIENALCRAIGAGPPQREIRPLKQNEFKFLKPDHKNFPGIKIVLRAFKNSQNPHTSQKNTKNLRGKSPTLKKINASQPNHPQAPSMRAFLHHEERVIRKFLDGQLTFPEIFEELSLHIFTGNHRSMN